MGTLVKFSTIEEWLAEAHPTVLSEWQHLGGLQFVVAGLVFDSRVMSLAVDGRSVHLTPAESRLVELLWTTRSPANRTDITRAVWNKHYIPNIDNPCIVKIVERIRKKIESDPRHPQYLVTIRGFGYKIVR